MWIGVMKKKSLRDCPQDGWEMLPLEDKDVKAFIVNMTKELKEICLRIFQGESDGSKWP